MERTTVPFRIGTTVEDMMTHVSAEGVVRIEDGCVVIEYRETRTEMTTLKVHAGPVREVRIAMADVESMEVGRRWPWGTLLRIRARKLSSLAGVPGTSGNELKVRVRRGDHSRARALCIATSLILSGEEIRRLEGDPGRDD